MIAATIDASAAAATVWDAIVIGAGPAGALTAKQVAAAGASVLLLDRATFPRDKVCGCCLNATALGVLERCGVAVAASAPTLRELQLRAGGRSAGVTLSAGAVISRSLLDVAIICKAINAGAAFLSGVAARVCGHTGQVLLGGGVAVVIPARFVIVADGIGGSALRDIENLAPRIARRSRIGLGAITRSAVVPRGRIVMCVGTHGYVGMVRVDGPRESEPRLDIAAAIDPAFIRACGSPAHAVTAICDQAGAPVLPAAERCRFTGTAGLSRRRVVEHDHIYVVGDAAGYIEPFTGEGIAWALAGAEALAPIVVEGLAGRRRPGEWTGRYRQLIASRQTTCRLVATALRSPRIVALGIAACAAAPRFAERVIQAINREAGLAA